MLIRMDTLTATRIPPPARTPAESTPLPIAGRRSGGPGPVRHVLDERIAAILGDGRLRTSATLAATLRVSVAEIEGGLTRLATQCRVRRSGYAPPPVPVYGLAWPTLWGRAA